ncbi:hypothetical protein [Streptomyces sp. NPDC049040]|uniref:hypothetical protein n=1 Tax=Streptomyces sp. NPDC049040 TaxID=3365593 RepID=UPI003710BF2E
MRAGWAAVAAVAVVCAVPMAADGAAAVSGGAPDSGRMDKGEIQADVAGVLTGLGMVRQDRSMISLAFYAGRTTPMPEVCEARWPHAWGTVPQDFPRLVSALGRDGWHRHTRSETAGERIASFDRGGWRLSVLDSRALRRPDFPASTLSVTAVRLDC